MGKNETRDSLRALRRIFRENTLNILSVLSVSPLNPREIAKILEVHETKIARELKRLEELGIVRSSWARVGNRNVKLYSLAIDGLKIAFGKEGVKVILESGKHGKLSIPVLNRASVPRIPVFVGREQEIELLKKELKEKTAVVVTGIAGIGKTTLVAFFVSKYVKKPVFWHQFSEYDTFEYLSWKMARFLGSLGYYELLEHLRSGDKTYSIIRDLILEGASKIKALMVFDDYQKVSDNKVLKLIRDLVEGLSDSEAKIIIISRRKPKGIPLRRENIAEIDVKGLKIENLVDLFKIKGLNMPSSYIVKVYKETLGHPLMLTMFINVAKRLGVEKALASLYFGDSFKFLWSEVYDKLSFKEKEIVNALALADEPLSYDVLKNICGYRNLYPLLSKLIDSDIIHEINNTYLLHDLIKSFLRSIKPFDEREVYRKIAEAYLREEEFKSAILALKYFVEADDPEGALKALVKRYVEKPYMILRYLDLYVKILENILDKIHGKHRWRKVKGYILYDLGVTYRIRGHIEEAIKYYNESLNIAEEVGDEILESMARTDRIFPYVYLNMLDKAFQDLVIAKSKLETIDNPKIKYIIEYGLCANASLYYATIGDFEKALECVKRELEISKIIDDPIYYGNSLMHLGDVYILLGKIGEAERALEECINVVRVNGELTVLSVAALSLTLVYALRNKFDKALEIVDEASKILCKYNKGNRCIEALTLKALVKIRLGELKEAFSIIEDAMAIYRKVKWDFGGLLHLVYGIILRRKGFTERGNEVFEKGYRKASESKLYSVWASLFLNILGEKVN